MRDIIPGEPVLVDFGKERALVQLPLEQSNMKLLLFFHGRGGDAFSSNFALDEFTLFRRIAAEKGYVVIVPDYGSDCWMNQQAEEITSSILSAISSEISFANDKIYIMGVSMGGAAALIFAARHPHQAMAVCDIMGITDIAKFYNESPAYHESICTAYGGSPDECPDIYYDRSAVFHADKLSSIPVFLVHGETDDLVSPSYSESMYYALEQANGNAELLIVPGVGHDNAIIRGIETSIIDWFEAALRNSSVM